MKFLKAIFFSSLCLFIPFTLKREFKLPPVQKRIHYQTNWQTDPPSKEILKIFDQPFSYLAHGNQSTVFVSEDQKYVLKLFLYKRSIFPLIQNAKNLFKKKAKLTFEEKTQKTFNATYLAATDAASFTQVVFAHLNLTENLLPKLKANFHGKTYTIPLDLHRFAVQRKAKPFKEALLEAKENPEKMDRLLDSFISLLIDRVELGIRNSDPNLGPNFGFINDTAVEIDFGNYMKLNLSSKMKNQEIQNFLIRLEVWLSKNAPEYTDKVFYLRRKLIKRYDPN